MVAREIRIRMQQFYKFPACFQSVGYLCMIVGKTHVAGVFLSCRGEAFCRYEFSYFVESYFCLEIVRVYHLPEFNLFALVL